VGLGRSAADAGGPPVYPDGSPTRLGLRFHTNAPALGIVILQMPCWIAVSERVFV